MLEARIWKVGAGVWMMPETDWTVETTKAPLAVKVLVVMLPPWLRRVAKGADTVPTESALKEVATKRLLVAREEVRRAAAARSPALKTPVLSVEAVMDARLRRPTPGATMEPERRRVEATRLEVWTVAVESWRTTVAVFARRLLTRRLPAGLMIWAELSIKEDVFSAMIVLRMVATLVVMELDEYRVFVLMPGVVIGWEKRRSVGRT